MGASTSKLTVGKRSTGKHSTEKRSTGQLHAQAQSPLWGLLPPEIREDIFLDVFTATPNPENPYPFFSYYYRPGFTAPKTTHLDILLTCKQAYIEGKDLVWKERTGNTELAFWWGEAERRPPHAFEPRDTHHPRHGVHNENHPFQSHFTQSLTTDQWSKITTIQIFPQLYTCRLSTYQEFFRLQPALQPHTVKITIRYTDWWWWERGQTLDISSLRPHDDFIFDYERRINRFRLPKSCRTLLLELETSEAKKDELTVETRKILANRNEWRWKLDGEGWLEVDPEARVEDWTWVGPTRFKGEQHPERYPHHPQGDSMTYIVKTLAFKQLIVQEN
ncbi:hypothetical protein CC1G_12281 [Coprinopsis cinerea okayama7|uniref:Uncharacterized protein n=1 Tax=Coprinopsis cinerea (strain Okayama-7 / 130 / ATCC MYA-4618 / FGSC 9003) TaxID=240176 RepID=A8MZS1_COPC7|nr:hypothetical protein CC1G_12281 [Coprinopsis cinerea okayama7\|eukprot:XP_001828133.1 hypothetical protein CC1G_12281 [Coprinopsis cinerea okayama7\